MGPTEAIVVPSRSCLLYATIDTDPILLLVVNGGVEDSSASLCSSAVLPCRPLSAVLFRMISCSLAVLLLKGPTQIILLRVHTAAQTLRLFGSEEVSSRKPDTPAQLLEGNTVRMGYVTHAQRQCPIWMLSTATNVLLRISGRSEVHYSSETVADFEDPRYLDRADSPVTSEDGVSAK